MILINGQGQGDGIPKGRLVLIKQDSKPRFDVVFKDQLFYIYDQLNDEWNLAFKDTELQEALDICLMWNLNELREAA